MICLPFYMPTSNVRSIFCNIYLITSLNYKTVVRFTLMGHLTEANPRNILKFKMLHEGKCSTFWETKSVHDMTTH